MSERNHNMLIREQGKTQNPILFSETKIIQSRKKVTFVDRSVSLVVITPQAVIDFHFRSKSDGCKQTHQDELHPHNGDV
jgi:hypothetical protein